MSNIGEQRPKRKGVRRGAPKAKPQDQAAINPGGKAGVSKTTGSKAGSAKTGAPQAGTKGSAPSASHNQGSQQHDSQAKGQGGQRRSPNGKAGQGGHGGHRGAKGPARLRGAKADAQIRYTKGNGVKTRRLAASVLVRVEHSDGWVSPILDEALTQSPFDDRDRAFVANLVFSTTKMLGTVDAVLGQVMKSPIASLDPHVRATLRLGTWELIAGHAPDHAVVKSHVDAVASQVKGRHLVGFTNGVLRGVIREREDIHWLSTTDYPHDRAMAFALGYPLWLVEAARSRFGNETESFLRASNKVAPTCLRAIGDPDALVATLTEAGINAKAHPHVPGAVLLTQRGRSGDLDVVQAGQAVIQDAASQAVVLTAVDEMNAGDRAIDLCAAPGGKALGMAQHDLKVIANDLSEFRLQRLVDQMAQFQVPIRIHVGDGRTFTPEDGQVDLVLLDAPCSGLGVMRRRPEIRWRRQPDDIGTLATLQGELFDHALSLVKPGGKLVYSVCTWTEEETDGVIAAALERHPGLEALPFPLADLGQPTRHGMLMTPHRDQADGMFIAAFRKPVV